MLQPKTMPKIFTLKQLEVYKGEDDAERHEGKVVFAVRDAKSAASATKYNVYDVTKYLEDHPGGDDIMKENRMRNQVKRKIKQYSN